MPFMRRRLRNLAVPVEMKDQSDATPQLSQFPELSHCPDYLISGGAVPTGMGSETVLSEPIDHYGPNRHDTGSTTARSVDEVAPIRDTISHYAPVLIAPLSNRRAGVSGMFFLGDVICDGDPNKVAKLDVPNVRQN